MNVANNVDEMGPIGYLVVEFPGSRMTGEGLPLLVDLVDRGTIRIMDLVFVKKEPDNSVIAAARVFRTVTSSPAATSSCRSSSEC